MTGHKVLAADSGLFMMRGMATSVNTGSSPPDVTPVQWDEDLIYHIVSDRSRRRILLALAKDGPKTAFDLQNIAHSLAGFNRRNLIIKHLGVMRRANLIVMSENPRDRRRSLYALAPGVPIMKLETRTALNFGFCIIHL